MTTLKNTGLSDRGIEVLKETGVAGFIGRFEVGYKRLKGSKLTTGFAVGYAPIYFVSPQSAGIVAYTVAKLVLEAMAMNDDEMNEALEGFKALANSLAVNDEENDDGKH